MLFVKEIYKIAANYYRGRNFLDCLRIILAEDNYKIARELFYPEDNYKIAHELFLQKKFIKLPRIILATYEFINKSLSWLYIQY